MIWPWPSSVRCRAKVAEHPDIVVTGTVSEADKWDILAGAQVMVNPSAYESFSLVLLEAWILGVPVLVNAVVRRHHGALPAVGRGPLVRLVPIVRGGRGAIGRRSVVAIDTG